MYPTSKSKSSARQSLVDEALVSKPMGYINPDDPFEDDDRLALQPWWEVVPDPGRMITHEMISEALWHAVMVSATRIRYKYIKAAPLISSAERQREFARAMIIKMQLLDQLAGNWHKMGLLYASGTNFTWLKDTMEGMQGSYQKRYGVPYPVPG